MSATMPERANAGLQSLQPYPRYKESGVEWPPQIPVDWKILRLKQVAKLSYGDSLPEDGRDHGTVPVYGSNGIVGYHSKANTLAPALIVGRKGSYGKVNFSGSASFAIDTTYYIDRRGTESDLRWFYYATMMLALDAYSEDSAVPGLSRDFVYERLLPVPRIPEQFAIASFLDRETAKIDALVAKKERLIELLQEKRAALITRAVTKGVNPTVPMKDSGVEWLGEIPAHWEVRQLKYLSRLHRGYDLPETDREEGQYPVVTSGGVVGYHLYSMAKGPGVVTGRYGSTGAVFYIDQDFWPHNTALYVSDFYSNIPKFVFYLLQTLSFEAYSAKSAVPGIDRNDLHEIRLPQPPPDEQLRIVKLIEEATAKIDTLMDKVREGIEKLKEYRTALISAAVTGKIDVRAETSL